MPISKINIVNTNKKTANMTIRPTDDRLTDATTLPPRRARGTQTDNGVPEYLQRCPAIIDTLIKADILPELNT